MLTYKQLTVLAAVLLMSGCAVKDKRTYYWGQYENVVYGHHLKADEFSAHVQIKTLTKDIEKAQAIGKPVAPGVYAHLGMLYASIGNLDSAIDSLNAEKKHFPESSILIDGLTSSLKSNNNN